MTKLQKRGWTLICCGLVLILASLLLHFTQEQQDQMAGNNADILLQQLELSRVPTQPSVPQPNTPSSTDIPMSEKEYLRYSMIGTIRVPSVDIELPVLSSWSYELLNVAPCRYYGSISGENMIIMGHNYKSHFTPLHDVAIGSDVVFEDVNGATTAFQVAEITTLHKNEGEKLPSEYPLTLFTCTPGGQNRIIVRCESYGGP